MVFNQRDFRSNRGNISTFVFSMLGIVLADNLISMFIFWELVGLSSYLLTGFWVERPAAGAAANKAFLVNRIGDFGFILGILGAWALFGSVTFADLPGRAAASSPGWAVTAVGLGLFCGLSQTREQSTEEMANFFYLLILENVSNDLLISRIL